MTARQYSPFSLDQPLSAYYQAKSNERTNPQTVFVPLPSIFPLSYPTCSSSLAWEISQSPNTSEAWRCDSAWIRSVMRAEKKWRGTITLYSFYLVVYQVVLLGEHWIFLLAYPAVIVELQHVNSLLHPKTLFVLFPKFDPSLTLAWSRWPARLV